MERAELMSHLGVYYCPDWCMKDDEEVEYQAHLTPWYTLVASSGDTFLVRGLAGWVGNQGANELRTTQLIVASAEGSPRVTREEAARYGLELADGTRLHLSNMDWFGLQSIASQAEMDLAAWLDHGDQPVCGWDESYRGAHSDAVRLGVAQ